MSRIVGGDGEMLIMKARARIVPIVSTMAGSIVALAPIVATAPVLPPFGLMMLLGWRLLRPQLWPVWMALPLGLFDDLMSGQPLGSAMALWTICMIMLDFADRRPIWRDYLQEWAIAAMMIAFCLAGGVLVTRHVAGYGAYALILPQIAISILAFPQVLRVCAALDRWRLA